MKKVKITPTRKSSWVCLISQMKVRLRFWTSVKIWYLKWNRKEVIKNKVWMVFKRHSYMIAPPRKQGLMVWQQRLQVVWKVANQYICRWMLRKGLVRMKFLVLSVRGLNLVIYWGILQIKMRMMKSKV